MPKCAKFGKASAIPELRRVIEFEMLTPSPILKCHLRPAGGRGVRVRMTLSSAQVQSNTRSGRQSKEPDHVIKESHKSKLSSCLT